MPPEKPCVLDADCPAQRVLALVADKWTALAIHALAPGTRRFGELSKAIGGISQKMLTQTLRELEEHRLVSRTVHAVVPPHVDYELTPLGRTLIPPLRAICRWAEEHGAEVFPPGVAATARRARSRSSSRPARSAPPSRR